MIKLTSITEISIHLKQMVSYSNLKMGNLEEKMKKINLFVILTVPLPPGTPKGSLHHNLNFNRPQLKAITFSE